MRQIIFSLTLLLFFSVSTIKVIAPHVSFAKTVNEIMNPLHKAYLVRQEMLAIATDEANKAVEATIDADPKDLIAKRAYANKIIEFLIELGATPLQTLPVLADFGFKFVPSFLSEYYGQVETIFEIPVMKAFKKGFRTVMVRLEDWQKDFIVEMPKIQSIFSEYDSSKIIISSGYSEKRMHPVYKIIKSHHGTDYKDTCAFHRKKTPLFFPCGGFATTNPYSRSAGYSVTFTDSSGIFSFKYCHLRKKGLGKYKNEPVNQTDSVGFIGKEGITTGYNMHGETCLITKGSEDKIKHISVNPEIVADWIKGDLVFYYWYIYEGKAFPVRASYAHVPLRKCSTG